MKRQFLLLALVLVLCQGSLWAQDVPKAEVFTGFSVLHISDAGFKSTPVGAQVSIAGNVNKMFGIVGDFSGEYKDHQSPIYTYMGGPQFSHRTDKATVFAHALYGGTKAGASSGNMFTMGYGGGVDYSATPSIAIRVIQFDWMPIRDKSGNWTKNVTRYGFGVVWKFAKK